MSDMPTHEAPLRKGALENQEDSPVVRSSPVLPRFIVAGVPKCGTTSLVGSIFRHPQVVRTKTSHGLNGEELMYFYDPKWEAKIDAPTKDGMIGMMADALQKEVLSSNPDLFIGDGSVVYVYGFGMGVRKMAELIKECLPGVKIIICVRDPVARAASGYSYSLAKLDHALDMFGIDRRAVGITDMLDMMKREIAHLETLGINADSGYKADKLSTLYEAVQSFNPNTEGYDLLRAFEHEQRAALREAGRMEEKYDVSKLTCWKCGELGHIQSMCTMQSSSNPQGMVADINNPSIINDKTILGATSPPNGPMEDEISLVEKVMRLSPDERLKEIQKATKLRFQDSFDIFVSTGLYGLLLEPWFEVFGSDLLVLSADSLKGDNYNKTMNSVFNHIGLSPYEVPNVQVNVGDYVARDKSEDDAKSLLREYYKPFNARFAKLLEKYSVDTSSDSWSWLYVD